MRPAPPFGVKPGRVTGAGRSGFTPATAPFTVSNSFLSFVSFSSPSMVRRGLHKSAEVLRGSGGLRHTARVGLRIEMINHYIIDTNLTGTGRESERIKETLPSNLCISVPTAQRGSQRNHKLNGKILRRRMPEGWKSFAETENTPCLFILGENRLSKCLTTNCGC